MVKSTTKPKNNNLNNNNKNDNPQEETVPDIEDLFTDHQTHVIRESLLEWYDHNRRDLPWRGPLGVEAEKEGEEGEKRAYGVWVSEVMLQQTRVQTVVGYYNRWMEKWPTLHHLADASLEEVNEMWAGLGYYRRARFLFEGAKMIAATGDGFPNSVSSLRKVPGIGEYTAGAIASIAFKEVVPVVDGNVIRVLARLRAISANPKDRLTIKRFWKLAAQVVDPYRPGDFNQSLMELGATLCTPLNPSCSTCPISDQCRALSISKTDETIVVTDYPAKTAKVKQRHDFSAVCVVEILESYDKIQGNQSGKFLLVKRPDGGLLAGLWEFPSVKVDKQTDSSIRRKEINSYLMKEFGLDHKKTCTLVHREDVGEFIHIFTHIRLKVYVELLVLHLKGGISNLSSIQDRENGTWKCVDNKTLSSLGLTSGVRKVYDMVEQFKETKKSNESQPSSRKINTKRQRHS